MAQTGLGPLYATDRVFRDQVDHIVSTLAPAMVRACADTITCERLAQGFASPPPATPPAPGVPTVHLLEPAPPTLRERLALWLQHSGRGR
jgi:hypothetical protein